jgi:pimeloyl-ACP methyl ester carboxylesterase
VLFHGNGSMIQDLLISGVVDRLASRYRVLCFDRPGFGYSQRPRMRIWTATSQAGAVCEGSQSAWRSRSRRAGPLMGRPCRCRYRTAK